MFSFKFFSAESASSSSTSLHKPLPRIFKLQLDNCSGDNKNKYVFSYLSLLTARGHFEEVIAGFLIPGHTHEDVDAMFGHFSEALMHDQASCLPDLMALLMNSRKPNPVPIFVQEVPDFKSYLQPFILSGSDRLVGHKKPRLFRFYVRHDSMPCFQYKLKTMDMDWLPEEGIEMWSWTEDGRPNLPVGAPKRLPMDTIKMLDEVKEGIQKYIEFYQLVHSKSGDAGKEAYAKLIDYWQDVLHVLQNEEIQYKPEDGEELVHGFWPISNWRDQISRQHENAACELDTPVDYVGPQRQMPRQAFNPRVDITKGHVILQRPHEMDMDTYPVYMGFVVSDVEEGELNAENKREHVCFVKWYRPLMPKNRRREYSEKERWENCWNKKWERDLVGYKDAEKISVNSVIWSFKPRKNSQVTGYITIPKKDVLKAQDCLARSCEADALV